MTHIVVDPKQFGIEETKAAQISAQFKPMLDKMTELENEYNEVIKLPIEDKATSAKAKELRLKYVKIRTGTVAIHKEQKEFYLKAGRFIDGWKNTHAFASEGIESNLEAIEKHFENLEKQRISKLQFEREELLSPFGVDGSSMPLGTMQDDVWNNYLTGTKLAYDQRIKAEKKAERERLEAIRKDNEEREAQRKENERLKAEADKRELEIQAERAEALRLQGIENEKRESELKAQREENERIQAEANAKVEAERKERERIENELREKQQTELKAKEEAEAKAEAELSKGDKDKFQSLIDDMEALKVKYSFKSKKYKTHLEGINISLDKIINWAISKQ